MQKMIEHEPMIRTTKGMIPQSALHDVNEVAKNQAPPPVLGPVKLDKTCPLKSRMFDARCDTSCALYIPEVGCGIKERCMGAGTACPWPGMAHCGKSCALYEDGSCALVK